MDEEINLLDYFRVVNKYKRLIIILCVGSVLITMIVSLLMPKMYESTVSILSPEETSSTQIPLSANPGIQEAMSVFGMGQRSSAILVAILNSRSMTDTVIKKFKLLQIYKTDLIEDARKRLKSLTNISISKKNELISITVQDTNPNRSADIANFYVTNLDLMSRKLALSRAKQSRLFIEKRLIQTEESLKKTEEKLMEFKTQHKLVAISEQAKTSIDAAAQLESEITALEVQLKVLESYATSAYPEVAKTKLRIKELKRKLDKMEYGKETKGELHIPFSKTPKLELELTRLLRELKVQEAVFELLTQQYEQAKISEAKDTPTVQILDKAIPSNKKCKPKIKLNMAIAGILSLFIGIFLSFFLEYIKRIKEEATTPGNYGEVESRK